MARAVGSLAIERDVPPAGAARRVTRRLRDALAVAHAVTVEAGWLRRRAARRDAANDAVRKLGAPPDERKVEWMQAADADGKVVFFADVEWNGRSYDDIEADGGRGWCVT